MARSDAALINEVDAVQSTSSSDDDDFTWNIGAVITLVFSRVYRF